MSFNWLGVFRVGSYRAFRTFSMHELRDAKTRLATIDIELRRIGSCSIQYHPKGGGGEGAGVTMTEKRKGFSVSPDTSLGRLLQAYVALGGNPFDISMFLQPSLGVDWVVNEDGDNVMNQRQPLGGVAYPMDRDESNYRDGGLPDLGGHIPLMKNPKGRIGSKEPWANSESTAVRVRAARRWLNQSLKEKRNNIEWQIIKLMDLREQLQREKTLIQQAAGGFVTGVDLSTTMPQSYTLPNILEHVDNMFFASPDEETGLRSVDRDRLARGVYDWLMNDYAEEVYTAL